MIKLRAMQSSEFAGFLEYFIPDYTTEISTNYAMSLTKARAQAEQEIAAELKEGVQTSGQQLQVIVDASEGTETLLGYIWYSHNENTTCAFIYEFSVLADFQSKGIGIAALHLLETELAAAGIEQVKLRVATNNLRALNLYRKSGFRETGINMSKNIGSSS